LNELKVGFFTLLAIASLVTVSLRMTSSQNTLGSSVQYKTFVSDATGIFPKTQIKVAGITAGRIKTIELVDNQALITFDITESIKVTEGAVIKIKSVGFLGDKYIDISTGPQDRDRLEPGSLIRSEVGGGIEDLAKGANEVIGDVKIIVSDIKKALQDDDKSNALRKIVQNIKDVTDTLKNVTKGKENSLESIIDNVNKLTKQLADETDRNLDGSFMYDLKKVGPILDNANKAMADLQVVMADLKAGKGTIGKLMRDEQVVDQVSETLSSVNRLMNRINNIEADMSIFTGINSDDGSLTQAEVDIFPAPERFFRLGLVVTDFGPDGAEERTITSTTGGVTTVENRREVEEDKLKFNLQIGRRIQRVGLRAGLFQTTGGVAIDYHYPDYGSRLSLEVFDYQENVGPYVRLMAEVRMWNVFYARFSGEDLTNSDTQSFTISAGLRFTDQDLTSVIGLLAR
jgi:phospholipid/cholesterol/gamma-HCH transport system substrate-binding protein